MEENYNIFEAVYPSIEADNKRQSRGYETLVRNNMDTAEFMGEQPDNDAGVIDRTIKGNELNSFIKDTVDFIASIPADTLIGITRAGANVTQKGIQLGRFIADEAGIDYAVDDLTAINDKINKFKEGLNKYQEDSPFVTKLLSYGAQEGSAVYPLYRKFKQMGVPKSYAIMLAFGIGGTLALGPEDQLTLDSKAAKYFKDVFKVEEGTPGEDIYNMGWAALENTFIGKAFDEVIEGLRYGKKIAKGAKIDQAAIAAGGGATAGAVLEKVNPEGQMLQEPNQPTLQEPNQPTLQEPQQPMLNEQQDNFLDEKKKFGQVQTDYPPDNQIAGGSGIAKQIFKSMLKEGAEKLPNKGSGAQFLGQLKNTPGIKEAELKWTGLDDYLQSKKTVTKDEIKNHLANNNLDISEIKFGGKGQELSGNLFDRKISFENKYIAFQEERLGRKFSPQEKRAILDNNLNYDEVIVQDAEDASIFNSIPFNVFDDTYTRQTQRSFNRMNKGTLTFSNKVWKVSDLELEKYNLEKDIRKSRMQSNKPKYEEYTSPGGKDYTELVFKIKNKNNTTPVVLEGEFGTLKGNKVKAQQKTTIDYISPHFNKFNEIAHVRFKTRDLNGKKVLTVEEMQSDILQESKREMFTSSNAVNKFDEKKLVDFPFKNNWYELVMKRLIRYGADNDFDAIAIPRGKVAQNRYGQKGDFINSIKVRRVEVSNEGKSMPDLPVAADEITLDFLSKDGTVLNSLPDPNINILRDSLKDYKIKAEDLDNLEDFLNNTQKSNSGERTLEFEVGDKKKFVGKGKGKIELYDKAIPSFLKKYGKKWNAKVYDDKFTVDDLNIDSEFAPDRMVEIPVTIIKITDDMKKSVQEDGQALFNYFGIGTAGAAVSQGVLDSQGNNTISQSTNN